MRLFYCLLILSVFSCQQKSIQDIPQDKLFSLIPKTVTGIDFKNEVEGSKEMNIFSYRNFYNGGGVGIGDVNNDGLPDIYLTANMKENKLFLNLGNWRFKDITKEAGVEGKKSWSTGVAMVDINGDGLLDIYVCNSGNFKGDDRANELFINQGIKDGIPTFVEQAKEYGIADEGLSTHAAFFDYDKDGDLDLYLLNNSFRPISSFGLENLRNERDIKGGDKLYRNDNGKFTDVSTQANIYGSVIGFGLGVTIGDVNDDGWLDIYVSNDFFEIDYLYINQKNGTFKESLREWIAHTSEASMGADMADINNDGRPEIFSTDMLPETDGRLKRTTTFNSYDTYQEKLKQDYYHQFTRNMLQLNIPLAKGTKNGQAGFFTEIGQISGVSATDWSWGALIMDLDNDGLKDIFVSNGIFEDLTNQDFVNFLTSDENIMEAIRTKSFDFTKFKEKSNPVFIPNYAFKNNGDLTFTNKVQEWGLDQKSFSNGSAYADLDNDGDLDLIVNNVNQEAFIYRNNAEKLEQNNYLKVKLVGEGKNTLGIGAKVMIFAKETPEINIGISNSPNMLFLEQAPARGFQSSIDPVMNFGLGKNKGIDSLVVIWSSGRKQVLPQVKINQQVVLEEKNAQYAANQTPESAKTFSLSEVYNTQTIFQDISQQISLDYKHLENEFNEFNRERLIPQMFSTLGPKIAKGDINGDGLEDFYIGGAKDSAGKLFIQQKNGTFLSTNQVLFETDKASEDTDALFFDADGDRDLDLYVVSGGNEFSGQASPLQDRLYLNDGRGNFKKAENAIPSEFNVGSCVQAADFDGDGDLDLFVGSRVIPFEYGIPPRNMLLQNDGKGVFKDVIKEVAPDLERLGLVSEAVWADFNGDKKPDLVVVGDWLPIAFFENKNNKLINVTTNNQQLTSNSGFWNCLLADDFDNDGDIDFFAGNLGLNTKLQASAKEPIQLYLSDFDKNGDLDPILTYYKPNEKGGRNSYPLALKDELISQILPLKRKYLKYEDYAEKTIQDIFTTEELQGAKILEARNLQSCFIENKGSSNFEVKSLPTLAQLSPVFCFLVLDYDKDGNKDLLLAGNFTAVKPEIGNYDACYGLLLKGDGKNNFTPIPVSQSGFFAQGEVRDMISLRLANQKEVIIIAKNNDKVQILEKK
ncbi:VCBS repeat-containing protein [Thermoflexibacter ruber]|uniref:Repeat domain-containing protein n=1 Tax=Thermoflexibacter ruber TaxID=1003 RepID=A0A1I2J2T3_9BACT|nr:VCBS repeat-containing protein [Thermoflexibacter ruber]SFF48338.1 Repeat domain-containing protein [Thermoflexibacter ruber]